MWCGSNDELDWLAFRYVTGEMTADEQEQFETRLAEEQLAREAVDRAVELKEAIRLVSAGSAPVTVSRVRLAIWRRLAWGGITAACLVLVLGVVWRVSTRSQQPVVRHAPVIQHDVAGSLPKTIGLNPEDSAALAWVRLRATDTMKSLESESNMVEWGPLEDETSEPSPASDGQIQDELPSWLLTAVTIESQAGEGDR